MDFVHPFVRGGLDEKMRRMWLREIVAGLPPLDVGPMIKHLMYCKNLRGLVRKITAVLISGQILADGFPTVHVCLLHSCYSRC